MIIRKIDSLPKYIKFLYNVYRTRRQNTLEFQKATWEKALTTYDWDAEQLYGYDWGDPENPNDKLGNYLEVKRRLLFLIKPDTTILEIGSLGGKWTQYLTGAGRVICVDVTETSFRYLQKKIRTNNIEFYLTKGYELEGIPDDSVDIVFSMDTFARVPKKYIFRYFKECSRVLKPSGRIFFYLPCKEIAGSKRMDFVRLSLREIENYCKKNNFKNVDIDKEIINHGVILEAENAPK